MSDHTFKTSDSALAFNKTGDQFHKRSELRVET